MVEVRCHHVPDSVGKNPPGVKVSGVIHWVPATRSVPAEVRLYDRLFSERPTGGRVRRRTQPRLSRGGKWRPPRTQPGRRRARQAAGSWNGSAISCSTRRTPNPTRRSSTGSSRFVTRGRTGRSRRRRRRRRKTARTNTRPPKKSRIEYRAEARVRDPLLADRFATWPSKYGLGGERSGSPDGRPADG